MSMPIRTTTNVQEVDRGLDTLRAAVLGQAAARAVNRLTEQAQVAGLREVDRIYGIGPRSFEKYVKTELAKGGELKASITVKGEGLPLYLFDARKVKAGISVKVKGRRFVVPHAFVARMASGRVGVFARGSYGGKGLTKRSDQTFGRFVFGKGSRKIKGKRPGKGQARSGLPINELYTFAPPDAFANPKVTGAMNDRLFEQMEKVWQQEISFAMRARR